MKLLENIEELGNSMHDAIRNLADEMFGRELSNEEVGDIVSNLKLSDILVLDTAYTQGDKDKVAKILGFELNEYSMGRSATSAASERPKPGRREAPQAAAKEPAAKNTTQTNRNYSGGAQNAVTTKNIDNEDNPDAVMQDPEAIEESSSDLRRGDEVITTDGEHTGVIRKIEGDMAFVEFYSKGPNGKWQDTVPLNTLEFNEYADSEKEADDLRNMYGDEWEDEAYESNVVDMIEWLQRKAGIK